MLARSLAVLALLSLAVGLGGASCSGDDLHVISPAPGTDVTTFSFPITLKITPNTYDMSTLQVTLNGVPVTMSGAPPILTATVNPGAPLRDDNVLEVRLTVLNGLKVALSQPFKYLPAKARLHRITDPADLMTGPLAHGRVGDYLLENGVARFIVQDVAQRDLYSIGAFGGNIIDAELVGHPGKENFLELQPAINIETVLNAQTAEIVNDGQDGLPAVLRVCGPDDLIDYVNPSTVVQDRGGVFPNNVDDLDLPVEACTEYQLEPAKAYTKLTTTAQNLSSNDVALYVGDYINGGGELEQWTPPIPGTPIRTGEGIGIGEILATSTTDVLSYFGFGEGTGVDYEFLGADPPEAASASFTTSGVSYVIHGQSLINVLFFGNSGNPSYFSVPANGERAFVRHFGVGDGSGNNALEMQRQVRGLTTGTLRGCVTVGGVGGAVAAGVRIAVGDAFGGANIRLVRSSWVTGADGCYQGPMPAGTFSAAAAREGTPYEGGGTIPVLRSVAITNNTTTVQDFALPATGRVHVNVTDESNVAVPARVTIVGVDPSPDRALKYSAVSGGDTTTSIFNDISKDTMDFGVTRLVYAGANGQAEFDLEPGNYQIVVSRGAEYSAFSAPLSVSAGSPVVVNAQIARVLDTTGFISSDYHVHAIASPDSRVSNARRVMQFAGEGVDNIIITDHEARTSLTPKIAELGLTPFVHSTIGQEITTFDYGHFNAYPLGQDPTRVSGGSVDHGGAAPPGMDFPSSGYYDLSPAQIYAAVHAQPHNTSPELAVQINHIDSHFSPLHIDTSLVPPRSVLTAAEQARYRLDPSIANLYARFDALELWNGHNRNQVLTQFLNERIGIWMNLLNQGIVHTAIADSDTHGFYDLEGGGGARTWTPSSTDAPAGIVDDEIGAAVKAGRAVGGQGLYVQSRLVATDGSGAVADFSRTGTTQISVSNHQANLEIHAQAPAWAPYDRIEIYVNSSTTVTKRNPNTASGTPVLFAGVPTIVLNAGTDFTVNTVNVVPSVPGAQRYETTLTVPLNLPQDAWVVVVVRGTDGVSRPMFPVIPADLRRTGNTTLANLTDGNLGEDGVTACGFTNALYVDVNGNGVFDPPIVP